MPSYRNQPFEISYDQTHQVAIFKEPCDHKHEDCGHFYIRQDIFDKWVKENGLKIDGQICAKFKDPGTLCLYVSEGDLVELQLGNGYYKVLYTVYNEPHFEKLMGLGLQLEDFNQTNTFEHTFRHDYTLNKVFDDLIADGKLLFQEFTLSDRKIFFESIWKFFDKLKITLSHKALDLNELDLQIQYYKYIYSQDFIELFKRKITIGEVQLLANTYVKYLWLFFDDMPEPPLCPITPLVINQLPQPFKSINIVKFDSVDYYEKLTIAISRHVIDLEKSVAEWEYELQTNFENES